MKPPPVRIYRHVVPPWPGSGRRAMGGRKGEKPHKFSVGVGREPPKKGQSVPFNSAKHETHRARATKGRALGAFCLLLISLSSVLLP